MSPVVHFSIAEDKEHSPATISDRDYLSVRLQNKWDG